MDSPTARIPDREIKDKVRAAAELEFLPLPVAVATTLPMVAEGTLPPALFMAKAVAERSAKPTEGGLYLNTE